MEKEWKLYTTVQDAWDEMYRACEEAEKTIDFETYIFNNDEIGKKFLALFKRKAAEGVRVRLLLDAVGSIELQLAWPLVESDYKGIQVQFFRMLSPWRMRVFGKWLLRDHRKLLIVDSKVGFTGGVGINDNMKEWRDTQVEITGSVVVDMLLAFERMWQTTLTGRYARLDQPEYRQGGFRFMTNAPHRRQRFFYYELLKGVRTAQKSIYITTPYFFPNPRLFKWLRRQARAGIDVRVLIGEHSDLWIVDRLSAFFLNSALKAGIQIWQYQGAVIHAKSIVIDDKLAKVGSTNIDVLGLLFNYECDLVSTNADFVAEVRRQFLEDCEKSERLKLGAWNRQS